VGSRDPSFDDGPAREIEDLRERAERAERERSRCAGSPMVSPDETGWSVMAGRPIGNFPPPLIGKPAGTCKWLCAFATSETTVYRIQAGRGFAEAAAVLGADFDGVWGF
jgi:hypothetical protein